jgi:hypothetical protein
VHVNMHAFRCGGCLWLYWINSHTADKGWSSSSALLIHVDFENKRSVQRRGTYFLMYDCIALDYITLDDIDCWSLNHCWFLTIWPVRQVVERLIPCIWAPSVCIILLKISHIRLFRDRISINYWNLIKVFGVVFDKIIILCFGEGIFKLSRLNLK